MADYYTEFSFFIPLPDDPAKRNAIKDALEAWCEKREAKDEPLGMHWNVEEAGHKPGIWCRHNDCGYGNVDDAAGFIQEVLRALDDPKAAVVIEWANTCSKPRLDAYSGGACLVTAQNMDFLQPHEWAEDLIKRRGLERINTQ